jgi:hypothetical protein
MGAVKALQDRKIGMIQFEFIPANIATGVTMHGFFEVLQALPEWHGPLARQL